MIVHLGDMGYGFLPKKQMSKSRSRRSENPKIYLIIVPQYSLTSPLFSSSIGYRCYRSGDMISYQ
jgi:hypothetical protein